ncbi:MAG: PAS domain-containing protein [Candidatus Goldbacteria bacterium]|nr:PAS domain-containing protein [Candidatus Goldiibacteriota bacterium]
MINVEYTKEETKKYLNYIRIVLSFSLILAWIYSFDFLLEKLTFTIIFISLLVISNIIFILLPEKFYSGVKINYIVFIVDMAFIIIGAQLFTVNDLRFIVCIFLAIFISAISQSVKMSILIAIVVDSLYFFINTELGKSQPLSYEMILLNLPFIFIVSIHSSFIAEKANQEVLKRKEIERMNELLTKGVITKSRKLSDITDFLDDLSESFLDALIVLDIEGVVKIFNSAAENMLNIKKNKAINSPLKDLAGLSAAKDIIMKLRFENKITKDELIDVGYDNKSLKVYATATFITNKEGNKIGILLLLRKIY